VIHVDGEIESKRKPKITLDGGKKWAVIGLEKYLVTGPWNFYFYRSWQSFFLLKRMGFQKIWVEGNPSPIFLSGHSKETQERILDDTARAIYNITEYDNPERLMRPRKVDWVMIVVCAVAAFGIGIAIGGRI
jgi:hypothetical protein